MENKINLILDNLLKHEISKSEALIQLMNVKNPTPAIPAIQDIMNRSKQLGMSYQALSKETGLKTLTVRSILNGGKCHFECSAILMKWYIKSMDNVMYFLK